MPVAGFVQQISVAVGTFFASTQHLPLCVEGCLLLMLETPCLKGFLPDRERPLGPHNGRFRSPGGCAQEQPSANIRKGIGGQTP